MYSGEIWNVEIRGKAQTVLAGLVHFIMGTDVDERNVFVSEQKYNPITPRDIRTPKRPKSPFELVRFVSRVKRRCRQPVNKSTGSLP